MRILGGGSSSNQVAKSGSSSVDTLIGRQTEVLGDIVFTGGLHVDGTIKGKVSAASARSATLSISETGNVEGDIRVPTIVLNGAVTGDVYAAEKITLAPKARVNGNVYYKIIEMQSGAQVNGQMVHDSGEPPEAITHEMTDNTEQDSNVVDVRGLRRA